MFFSKILVFLSDRILHFIIGENHKTYTNQDSLSDSENVDVQISTTINSSLEITQLTITKFLNVLGKVFLKV